MRFKFAIFFLFNLFFLAANATETSAQGVQFYLVSNYDSTQISPQDHQLIKSTLKVFHEELADSTKARLLSELTYNINDVELILGYTKIGLDKLDPYLSTAKENRRKKLLRIKSRLMLNRSYALGAQGLVDEALETEFRTLRIHKELNDTNLLCGSYVNIAVLYKGAANTKKAKEYLLLAQDYAQDSDSEFLKAYSAYMLAVIYLDDKEYEKSKRLSEKALVSAHKIGNKQLIGMNSMFLAKSLQLLEKHTEALEHAEKARFYFEQANDQIYLTQAYSLLSGINYDLGKYSEAQSYAQTFLELALKGDYKKEIEKAYQRLYLIYEALGNNKKAYESYKLYVSTRDTLNDQINEKLLAEQEVKYKYEQQASADSIKANAALQLEKLNVEKKTQESNFLLIGLVIIVLFTVVILQRFRVGNKQKKQLEVERSNLNIANSKLNVINDKLNDSNDKLKELDKLKSEFFTNVSHEFRTPLTVISGMAEQINKNPTKNAESRSQLIKESSSSLLNMVEQILQLRKIEAGSIEAKYARGEVVKFIQYNVHSLESYAEDQNLSLKFETNNLEFVTGFDKEKLQSIVVNLVSNAIKYNRDKGTVECRVSVHKDAYNIEVEDSGIGISEKQLPHIFDRFYRIDQTEVREADGTGVGLALVKQLTNLMNGSISVDSKEGKGSLFTVSLPFVQSVNVHPETRTEPLPKDIKSEIAAKRAELNRVLIVEDNAQVKGYLNSLLEEDYELSFASNGEEGVNKALKEVPDFIISDVMMPRKSGFELVQELKEHAISSHIPIILLTAKADIDSKLIGLSHGADAYLSKPFNQVELKQTMTNLLKLRERIQGYYSKFIGTSVPVDKEIPEDKFINEVQQLLEKHLDQSEYDIQSFCKDLNMARSQVHNKLKAITGLSTSHYIQRFKVEKAKVLLAESKLTSSEIAYALGFNTPSYFSKVFTKTTGKTPGQFRD